MHDSAGHGTFVAALAAGADTNGEGIAGFGGSAKPASVLGLTGSATRGKTPLSVSFRASLSPASARSVTLESYTNGSWRKPIGGATNAGGRASRQLVLDRGTYRIRARFAGDVGLRPAVSRPVAIVVG